MNTWTHVATTFDGTTQRLFVGGVQVGSRAQTGSMTASAGALNLGGYAVWGEWFKGAIDEVRVYNRALTAAEIQSDMNSPVAGATPAPTPTPSPSPIATPTPSPPPTGPDTALVAKYGFNEGSGSAAVDSSGNGNVGALVGGATRTSAGKAGQALAFNGSSGSVRIADSSSLHLTAGMTLEAWVKPTALNGWS